MIERVTTVLREAIDSQVLPSFRALRPQDITAKDTPGDPDDIVTNTDYNWTTASPQAPYSLAKKPCAKTPHCSAPW